MIDQVKNETDEEKTFRYLKRYSYKAIAKVVSEFERSNVAYRYICKENALNELQRNLENLKNAVVTAEDQKNYEAEFAVIWQKRSALQKNLVDPDTYLDALEERIWKYGWTLDEYINFYKTYK